MISNTPWNLFHWKTVTLADRPQLGEPFSVRPACYDEKEMVKQVALLSLKMNTEWHDATMNASNAIHEAVKRAFIDNNTPSCLLIAHGHRIIGVSILDMRPEAPYHLLSGPWVLTEYRNRGFGSALLHASLEQLANQGITEVSGVTRGNTTSSRFVYPKFGGIMSLTAPPEFSSE
jgi:GNAT superfamily N-acetyltransferase